MLTIRKFRPADAKACAQIISETFKKYNGNEGTKKAVEDYAKQYSPTLPQKTILERFSTTPLIFVAVEHGRIIGVVRGRKNKLTNLFVLGEYHGKGIGRKLLERLEREAKKEKSSHIKTRASLYAVPFYKRAGYKKTTGIRNFHGLKIQPMRKQL